MSNFFTTFPEMPNKQFREMKKGIDASYKDFAREWGCLLYTSPSPRDQRGSRMPSSA